MTLVVGDSDGINIQISRIDQFIIKKQKTNVILILVSKAEFDIVF